MALGPVSRMQLIVGVVATTLFAEGLVMALLPDTLPVWLATLLDAGTLATVAGLTVAVLTRDVRSNEPTTGLAIQRRVRIAYLGALALIVIALILQGKRFDPGSLLLMVGATGLALVLFMEPAIRLVVRTLVRVETERAEFDRLAMVARRTTNGIVVTDPTGAIEWANEGYTRLTGYTLEDVKGKRAGGLTRVTSLQGAQRERDDQARDRMRTAMTHGEGFRETLFNRARDGRYYHLDLDVQPLRDGAGALTGFIGVQTDVHEREVALERLRVRTTVLEAIHTGEPLSTVLDAMTAAIAEAHPETLSSVLLLEKDQLCHGAAVGLPVDYMKAIDGVRIGPDVGSCGTAAWSGELVIVSDIEHDPRWANYRDVALPHGLRSCWSRPFKNRKGVVLGCFALYAKEARGPTDEELEIITEAANLLGIALEQRATERENKLLHAAMESAAEVVVVTDEAGVITFANQVLDPAVQALPTAALSHLLPALYGPEVEPLLDAVRHVTSWEGRLRRVPECATAAGAWFQVKLTHAVSAQGTAGLLLTMSDVTATIEQERLQRLGTEGEKAKVAVAWALSVAAELRVRCEAALASVVGLLVPQGAGAVYVRESGTGHFERFAQAGEGADAFVLVPSSGCVCGQRLAGASTVVVDRCSDDPAHGHYLVPLMERAHEPLGYLLLHTEPSPTRAAPRLEALGMIAELITIAVVRDRADHLLRASKVAAEEANRAKSDFLATMSHEIRTPMNGILGFSELLLEAPLPDEQRGQLRLIRNSAEALLTVINDVLDYSKIEAGKFVIEPRPMNLVEATREPLELLRDAATRKGLSMELTLGSELPVACLMDPLRYRQVVLNLVGNAVKFTARGQVRVSVSQVTEGPRRLVRVEVADSGIGISAEVLPRLFEKFVQADSSTSRRFGGSGLGLAISRKLVGLMGGTMGVTSEVGVGSTFWFQLPAVDAVMPAASRATLSAPISLLGKRVLVAEDNEVNQLLARRTLERLGCEVVMAVNGLEAVAHARAGGFDLILMDCQMPELDGIAATSAIRAWEREQALPRLPIIALTASAFVEEVARCMEAGMDDVLTKPFKLADLASLLSRPTVAAAG